MPILVSASFKSISLYISQHPTDIWQTLQKACSCSCGCDKNSRLLVGVCHPFPNSSGLGVELGLGLGFGLEDCAWFKWQLVHMRKFYNWSRKHTISVVHQSVQLKSSKKIEVQMNFILTLTNIIQICKILGKLYSFPKPKTPRFSLKIELLLYVFCWLHIPILLCKCWDTCNLNVSCF